MVSVLCPRVEWAVDLNLRMCPCNYFFKYAHCIYWAMASGSEVLQTVMSGRRFTTVDQREIILAGRPTANRHALDKY